MKLARILIPFCLNSVWSETNVTKIEEEEIPYVLNDQELKVSTIKLSTGYAKSEFRSILTDSVHKIGLGHEHALLLVVEILKKSLSFLPLVGYVFDLVKVLLNAVFYLRNFLPDRQLLKIVDLIIKLASDSLKASTYEVGLSGLDYFSYFTIIEIGTGTPQKFKVVFDSGSSDLWVSHYDCKEKICKKRKRFQPTLSASFKPVEGLLNISYVGNVNVVGSVGEDQFWIPGLNNKTTNKPAIKIGLANHLPDSLDKQTFDGILGMGLDSKLGDLPIDYVLAKHSSVTTITNITTNNTTTDITSSNNTNSTTDTTSSNNTNSTTDTTSSNNNPTTVSTDTTTTNNVTIESSKINSTDYELRENSKDKLQGYSVYLTPLSSLRDVDIIDGQAVIGGVNPKHIKGKVKWFPVLEDQPSPHWKIKLKSIARLGDQKIDIIAESALIDTGSPVIGMPYEDAKAINKLLKARPDPDSNGMTSILPCPRFLLDNGLPDLKFSFKSDHGYVTVTLRPSDYAIPDPERKDSCMSIFVSVTLPKLSGPNPTWILGAPFMRRYTSIFDKGNYRIGLARNS